MIVAIQQPEFLPWIGFFNKMVQCDLYVYLDNVQFKKRYFENRNRIKTKDGIRWLSVPVFTKGKYSQKINQVGIDNESQWTKRYLGTVEQTYKRAPFWNDVKNIIFPCIEGRKDRLVDLNLEFIERCRNYLQIETPVVTASSLDVDRFSGSSLILEICLKTGADVYISGPDGRNYLKLDEFQRKGIDVVYHIFQHPVYPQLFGGFVPNMSIIDLIANCGPKSREIVKDCYRLYLNNED